MAIKLSLNKTLYSYDGQLEAYVTDTTIIKIQIYTDYDLSDSVLVYQQGDVQDSVAIVNNAAEIPGMNLSSGQLSVAVLYNNALSNFVQVYVTKAAALSSVSLSRIWQRNMSYQVSVALDLVVCALRQKRLIRMITSAWLKR